ncbi:hypothetical protein [Limnoglobus roseus]|uniref:Uncharacterized protein n=1 Tax=Limnoglobus roseus TaxID=2598579 RepID=A0A5C1A509_9BACT|nr:hypothetical protein [Limnoglobus roseus]QEL13423.1 hypothetical protein PX52LOC_00278 [Limnoglobus roseus]
MDETNASAVAVDEPADPVAGIRSHILTALGRPPDLLRVHVAKLWKNTYRANVFVGTTLASAQLSHSFFVTTTDAGQFLSATPPLRRVYT